MAKVKVTSNANGPISYLGETISPGENEIDAEVWAKFSAIPKIKERIDAGIYIADAVPIGTPVPPPAPDPEEKTESTKKKSKRGRGRSRSDEENGSE